MENNPSSKYPIIPNGYIRMIVASAISIAEHKRMNEKTLSILLENALRNSTSCEKICFSMGNLIFDVICYSKFDNEFASGKFDCYCISVFCTVTGVKTVYTWDTENYLSIYDGKFVKYPDFVK